MSRVSTHESKRLTSELLKKSHITNVVNKT